MDHRERGREGRLPALERDRVDDRLQHDEEIEP